MFLPKIYPITDTRISKISHAAQIEKLIDGGATLIQLREKHAAPDEFCEAARKASEIARKRGVKIIINDRVDIALAVKADGVHLGQDDLPPERAREILGAKAIIGFSTHDFRQAAAAVKMPIDYLAFGPIYATTTKENPDATVGIEALRKLRQNIGDFPLVAIGGINSRNSQTVLRNGADSIAVISDLISDADKITEKMRSFLSSAKSL